MKFVQTFICVQEVGEGPAPDRTESQVYPGSCHEVTDEGQECQNESHHWFSLLSSLLLWRLAALSGARA